MDHQEIDETARLARLALAGPELQAAAGAVARMLDHFAAMREADADEAAFGGPLSSLPFYFQENAAGIAPRLDNPASPDPLLAEALLANAGGRDGSFFVVPNVL